MHCIVSLSMATSLEDDLVTSSSAGFLCMQVHINNLLNNKIFTDEKFWVIAGMQFDLL